MFQLRLMVMGILIASGALGGPPTGTCDVIEYPCGELQTTPISRNTPIFRVQPNEFPLLPYRSPSFDSSRYYLPQSQYYGTEQIYFATNEATLQKKREGQGYFKKGDKMFERNLGEYIRELERKGYTEIRVVRDSIYDHSVAGAGNREGLIIVAKPPRPPTDIEQVFSRGNPAKGCSNFPEPKGSKFTRALPGIRPIVGGALAVVTVVGTTASAYENSKNAGIKANMEGAGPVKTFSRAAGGGAYETFRQFGGSTLMTVTDPFVLAYKVGKRQPIDNNWRGCTSPWRMLGLRAYNLMYGENNADLDKGYEPELFR